MRASVRLALPAIGLLALSGCMIPPPAQVSSANLAPDTATLRAQLHEAAREGHKPLRAPAAARMMARLHRDPDRPDHVVLLFSGRSQPAIRDTLRDNRDGWTAAHLWPRSRGAKQNGADTDLHHLVAADVSVDAKRRTKNFDRGGQPEGEAPYTLTDADSFEPRDAVKGDVARALFYMDVRYEGDEGVDLVLVRDAPIRGPNQLGRLCVLLDWHRADPPDETERRRHDLAAWLQGNRNPFIDAPSAADRLYGPACG